MDLHIEETLIDRLKILRLKCHSFVLPVMLLIFNKYAFYMKISILFVHVLPNELTEKAMLYYCLVMFSALLVPCYWLVCNSMQLLLINLWQSGADWDTISGREISHASRPSQTPTTNFETTDNNIFCMAIIIIT